MPELIYDKKNNAHNYSSDIQKLNSIKSMSIVSIVLTCTIIFILVAAILNIVLAIKILSTTWENKEVENEKILWGILTLLVLGAISSLIFSISGLNKIQ